jgi:lipid-A-disaccharide synthase
MLIVVGEKSGEELVLSFFKTLWIQLKNTNRKSLNSIEAWGVVGKDLEKEGVVPLLYWQDIQAWGVSGILHRLPFYWKLIKKIEKNVELRQTKVAILCDFQTFNLILAKRLKKKGVKIIYLVAPQAWVWKPWRVKHLRNAVHTLVCLLPFEVQWFQMRKFQPIFWLPHPFLKNFEVFQSEILQKSHHRLQAFDCWQRPKQKIQHCTDFHLLWLPGSRLTEVKNFLKIACDTLMSLLDDLKNAHLKTLPFQKIICEVVWSDHFCNDQQADLYHFLQKHFNVYLESGHLEWKWSDSSQISIALLNSHGCWATSGTVTLACSYFLVPTIVVYDLSLLNECVAEWMVPYRGPYALGNIYVGKKIFPELICHEFSLYNLRLNTYKWFEEISPPFDSSSENMQNKKNLLPQEQILALKDFYFSNDKQFLKLDSLVSHSNSPIINLPDFLYQRILNDF